MESRHKFLGHPMHQMAVMFPIGLLALAPIFDGIALFADKPVLAHVAYWNMVVGLCLAAFAAVFGFLDWKDIPTQTRASRIGAVHGITNLAVLGLFFLAVAMRKSDPEHAVDMRLFLIELGALVLLGVSGWLGGELVNRLGVGISDDANLNASNSLRGDALKSH